MRVYQAEWRVGGLHFCMCVFVCLCECVCLFVCVSVYVCACMPVCINVHSCSAGSHLVSVLIATRGNREIRILQSRGQFCMCVCMCVCVCVCVCV